MSKSHCGLISPLVQIDARLYYTVTGVLESCIFSWTQLWLNTFQMSSNEMLIKLNLPEHARSHPEGSWRRTKVVLLSDKVSSRSCNSGSEKTHHYFFVKGIFSLTGSIAFIPVLCPILHYCWFSVVLATYDSKTVVDRSILEVAAFPQFNHLHIRSWRSPCHKHTHIASSGGFSCLFVAEGEGKAMLCLVETGGPCRLIDKRVSFYISKQNRKIRY